MFDEIENSDSVSIKDIYQKILYFGNEIVKAWLVVLILTVIGAGVLGYYAYSSKSFYEADLSFAVKSKSGGGGDIDNILGQLGWNSGGGGSANLSKVKTIAFSKSVLRSALIDSAIVDGKNDIIANHILDIYDYKEQWKGSDELKNFNGFTDSSFLTSNRRDNIALRNVLSSVRGNRNNDGILAIELNSEIDVISFKVRSLNEELSYALSLGIFDALNSFYIQDEVANSRLSIRKLRHETDSISRLLRSKERQLAKARDRNYGIILRENQVNQEEINRDIQVLSGLYASLRERLELSAFSVKNSSSIFDMLEEPELPLKKKKKHLLEYSMAGAGLAFIACIIVIVVRRFLLDELK